MNKLALITAAIMGVAPQLTMAEVYFGGKAGMSIIDDACTLSTSCEDESFAKGIYAGFNANDYFGIEVGYDWLGEFETDLNHSLATDKEIRGFTIAPRLRYPIGSASIYGKLGGAILELDNIKETSLMGALGRASA